MREILFRGKRIDNSEWVEGFYVEREDGEKLIFLPIAGAWLEYEIIPESLGQYIKADDFEGYEGDIARDTDLREMGIVTFDEDDCYYGIKTTDGSFYRFNDLAIEWEVIGNTTDNPELLEEQQ